MELGKKTHQLRLIHSPGQANKENTAVSKNLGGLIRNIINRDKSLGQGQKNKLYVNLKDVQRDVFLGSFKDKAKYRLIRDCSSTRS